jgi:hypothetical protein
MPCYLCNEPRVEYFGYFCEGCLKYQNLCKLYKPEVVHSLLDKVLLVDKSRIVRKLDIKVNKD